MKNDPAHQPAGALQTVRHPFVDLAQAERENEISDDRADYPMAVEQLNLQLTNTVVGTKSRHATISGRVYKQGENLWLVPPNSTHKKPIETNIVVKSITTTSATLLQETHEITLAITPTSLANGDWISPGSRKGKSRE